MQIGFISNSLCFSSCLQVPALSSYFDFPTSWTANYTQNSALSPKLLLVTFTLLWLKQHKNSLCEGYPFRGLEFMAIWQGTLHQSREHGTRAESSHLDHRYQMKGYTGDCMGLWNINTCASWHIPSNKATQSLPSLSILLTGDESRRGILRQATIFCNEPQRLIVKS